MQISTQVAYVTRAGNLTSGSGGQGQGETRPKIDLEAWQRYGIILVYFPVSPSCLINAIYI